MRGQTINKETQGKNVLNSALTWCFIPGIAGIKGWGWGTFFFFFYCKDLISKTKGHVGGTYPRWNLRFCFILFYFISFHVTLFNLILFYFIFGEMWGFRSSFPVRAFPACSEKLEVKFLGQEVMMLEQKGRFLYFFVGSSNFFIRLCLGQCWISIHEFNFQPPLQIKWATSYPLFF